MGELELASINEFIGYSRIPVEPYSRDKNAAITLEEIIDETIKIDAETLAVLADWDIKLPRYHMDSPSNVQFSPKLWHGNSSAHYNEERRFRTEVETDLGTFYSLVEGYDKDELWTGREPNGPRRYGRGWSRLGYVPTDPTWPLVCFFSRTNQTKGGKIMTVEVFPPRPDGGHETKHIDVPTPVVRAFAQMVFKTIRGVLAEAEEYGPRDDNPELNRML